MAAASDDARAVANDSARSGSSAIPVPKASTRNPARSVDQRIDDDLQRRGLARHRRRIVRRHDDVEVFGEGATDADLCRRRFFNDDGRPACRGTTDRSACRSGTPRCAGGHLLRPSSLTLMPSFFSVCLPTVTSSPSLTANCSSTLQELPAKPAPRARCPGAPRNRHAPCLLRETGPTSAVSASVPMFLRRMRTPRQNSAIVPPTKRAQREEAQSRRPDAQTKRLHRHQRDDARSCRPHERSRIAEPVDLRHANGGPTPVRNEDQADRHHPLRVERRRNGQSCSGDEGLTQRREHRREGRRTPRTAESSC